MATKTITTESADQTKRIAFDFAHKLSLPKVIALYGDLGAGKTTFIQGLAKGLGITKRVLSPTFVFIRQYKLEKQQAIFYHVDLYRLDSKKDIEAIGLKEVLEDKNAIVAIEWPEKIEEFLPKNITVVRLQSNGENKRKITIV
ncbi:MAG: tRNA (adenosine(37)-N6)-threonylcarbamoyltransferase complex ATPase subunit type 1 TsaE [Candidatus Woykebacteria bacterium]